MFLRQNQPKIIITFILVLAITTGFGIIKNSIAKSTTNKQLSGKVYVDPKGFFKIRPPEGWELQEFKEDPRGKVKFNCPDAYNTVLQVIGAASPFSNLEELIRDGEMAADRMKSKYNASTTLEKTTFANIPVVKVSLTIPGKLKQIQMQFLLGKNHYTLAYGAPPDRYEEFLSIALKSFETIEPILKEATKDDAIRHSVASKLRTAKVLIQNGQIEYARIIINEGLQLDPNNKDLKELKKQIEKQ